MPGGAGTSINCLVAELFSYVCVKQIGKTHRKLFYKLVNVFGNNSGVIEGGKEAIVMVEYRKEALVNFGKTPLRKEALVNFGKTSVRKEALVIFEKSW